MDPARPLDVAAVSVRTPADGPPSAKVADVMTRHLDRLARCALAAAAGLDPLLDRPDDDAAVSGARTDLELLALALREGRPPHESEVDQVAGIASRRAREGVPREAFARGYSTVLRAVWAEVVELAADEGLDPGALHEALHTLWTWADAMAERASELFSAYDLERARHDEQSRTQFLHQLVAGNLSAADIRSSATAYGLHPGRGHSVVRAALADGVTLAELDRALRTALGGRAALTALQGTDVVGVVPGPVRLDAALGTVAVGPERDLVDLHSSDTVAAQVLAAALRFGRTGTVTLEDLGLRLLVAGDDDVGQHLEARYLAPVAGAKEDLAGTVDCYLQHGMRIEAVAKSLFLHPNSVRKRLHRYSELTGADLTEVGDVIQVWWAMRRREMHRAAPR